MSNLPLALITGGSRGLGYETARQLGKLGHRLFIGSRTPARLEKAAQALRAEGCLVTPGFVDIHTHLDAQISWDPIASSSCWHGVTSVVMGNCGVTFAPCRPQDREYLALRFPTLSAS